MAGEIMTGNVAINRLSPTEINISCTSDQTIKAIRAEALDATILIVTTDPNSTVAKMLAKAFNTRGTGCKTL